MRELGLWLLGKRLPVKEIGTLYTFCPEHMTLVWDFQFTRDKIGDPSGVDYMVKLNTH